jgi:hypothetical protein
MITSADIGKQVSVSDDTPRPPDRFNRKLADWNTRNYTGQLIKLDNFMGRTTAAIETDRNSYMVIQRSGVPLNKITIIGG